jgi:hypothetical protein
MSNNVIPETPWDDFAAPLAAPPAVGPAMGNNEPADGNEALQQLQHWWSSGQQLLVHR